ncbi:MAG: TlpA family protein disulfide reductase [Sandaracinaceae bacterium]|nr:TlpA family protein disulfide reductase [Sandaracinaceae bacterium]
MKRPALMVLASALVALGLVVASVASAGPTDLIGQPAPDVRARPLENDRQVGLDAYRGRVVVLAFVATWCGACRRMAPTFDALQREHGEAGLTILGLTHEPRDTIRAHVAQREPQIPWLQCTGRTALRYGADGLPTIVVIDRSGRVRAAYQGATDDVAGRLRRAITSLL